MSASAIRWCLVLTTAALASSCVCPTSSPECLYSSFYGNYYCYENDEDITSAYCDGGTCSQSCTCPSTDVCQGSSCLSTYCWPFKCGTKCTLTGAACDAISYSPPPPSPSPPVGSEDLSYPDSNAGSNDGSSTTTTIGIVAGVLGLVAFGVCVRVAIHYVCDKACDCLCEGICPTKASPERPSGWQAGPPGTQMIEVGPPASAASQI